MPLVLFLLYIEPSCQIFSAVGFLMKFLEYFLHGCDVYTMRHQMQNLQLLPLMRFSFRDVSETTSNYTAFFDSPCTVYLIFFASELFFALWRISQ